MYVYGLRQRGAALFFYVGSTIKPPRIRLAEHLVAAESGHHVNPNVTAKIMEIGPSNVTYVVLAHTAQSFRWSREKAVIRALLRSGHPLQNKVHNPGYRIIGRPVALRARSRISAERYRKARCILATIPPKAKDQGPIDSYFAAAKVALDAMERIAVDVPTVA